MATRTTTTGILLAAGAGERIGGRNKAWLESGGKTLLARTLETVAPCCGHIIIATVPEKRHLTRTQADAYNATCVPGGATRFSSILAALEEATTEHVLICDVARPNLAQSTIKSLQSAIGSADGAAPIVPLLLRESLAVVSEDRFEAILPREGLALTQTPQLFRRETVLPLIQRAQCENWNEVSLVALHLRAGLAVVTTPGDPDNVKITYPEDLERFGYSGNETGPDRTP